MNDKPFEQIPCKVETLSPLHIGTGEDITPFEYFMDGDRVVVYNLQRLLMDDRAFARELANRSEGFRSERDFFLSNLLQQNQKDNSSYHFYTMGLNDRAREELNRLMGRGNRANIRTGVKDGSFRSYIPGSSLKGAFRTAYAYSVLTQEMALGRELQKRLWKESREIVNRLVFQKEGDATRDLFRLLAISDNYPFDGAMQIEVGRRLSSEKLLGFSNLFEVIPPGKSASFELRLHSDLKSLLRVRLGWGLLERYPLTVETLVQYCRTFYGRLIAWEKDYFQNHPAVQIARRAVSFYEGLEGTPLKPTQCWVCLGQGGGFFAKTLAILLADTPGFDYAGYIKRFGRRKQGHRPQKTSRTIVDSDPNHPVFGWIRVTFGIQEEPKVVPKERAEKG